MNYKIAIPTHRRSRSINKNTLTALGAVSAEKTIFISDEADMDAYADIGGVKKVLCNTSTATEKFNFIQEYYSCGNDFIIVVEDDIRVVQSLFNYSLPKTIQFMVDFCNGRGIRCFGVYPSGNKYFMKPTIDIGLTYIVANLFAFKPTADKRLILSMPTKTDYERSVLYYLVYGDIARFNFVSCLTSNYTNKGGMQDIKNRAELEQYASHELCRLYPDIFEVNHSRKSRYCELKMKKNYIQIKI